MRRNAKIMSHFDSRSELMDDGSAFTGSAPALYGGGFNNNNNNNTQNSMTQVGF